MWQFIGLLQCSHKTSLEGTQTMGNTVKIGDKDTGHGSHPPTPVITGSTTVKVDGLPLARKGDVLAAHGHDRNISGDHPAFLSMDNPQRERVMQSAVAVY